MRRLTRLLRYRLIIPILRRREPPVISARGVMVGVICAMNPFVGAQMLIVCGVWAVQRAVAPNWRFSVVAALAWTWITNVFTIPFFYYVFLITGRLMLGQWNQILGFDAFSEDLDRILATDSGGLAAAWHLTLAMITLWGVPLFVGSIPYALVGGWIGYRWSQGFIERYRHRARLRLLRRGRMARARRVGTHSRTA